MTEMAGIGIFLHQPWLRSIHKTLKLELRSKIHWITFRKNWINSTLCSFLHQLRKSFIQALVIQVLSITFNIVVIYQTAFVVNFVNTLGKCLCVGFFVLLVHSLTKTQYDSATINVTFLVLTVHSYSCVSAHFDSKKHSETSNTLLLSVSFS